MQRPDKPHPDFPLFANQNGQWAKKVNGKPYYFGKWADDPKGTRALRDWLDRKDAILAGLDHVRTDATPAGGITLGLLLAKFTETKRGEVKAGTLSLTQFGDYLRELPRFVDFIGSAVAVASLQPRDFKAYKDAKLAGERSLGPDAMKRTIALVKAMFNWGAGNGVSADVKFGDDFAGPDTGKQAKRKYKARLGLKDYSKRIVTGGEVDKLLTRSQAMMKAIILLSVNTGMGPADLGRLRWRQLDLETGICPTLPRGKTGNDRAGFLWKKTRDALKRVRTLRHNATAIAREGEDALVFVSRKGLPMWRESEVVTDGVVVGVKVQNSISGTFSKIAKELDLEGVTQYRLRHTFKTLGKKARDPEALDLCMGHEDRSTGKVYDHEEIGWKRIKKVARVVYRRLWPKPKEEGGVKPVEGTPLQPGQMRLAV